MDDLQQAIKWYNDGCDDDKHRVYVMVTHLWYAIIDMTDETIVDKFNTLENCLAWFRER